MLEMVCGYDDREEIGYAVAESSARRRSSQLICPIALEESAVRNCGLYTRQHEYRNGQLWDVISDAPMSTSFACSRFLVPWIARHQWTLWCDFADMLFLADPAELFALADPRYAVMVVKHQYVPTEQVKMDGQQQTVYARKNWSSVILWNWQHPGNAKLTLHMVNTLPGRDLHRFCWLEDHEIGELPTEWNYLVGVTPMTIKPKLLHFTLGIPTMPGCEDSPWADVWKQELEMLDATRGELRAA